MFMFIFIGSIFIPVTSFDIYLDNYISKERMIKSMVDKNLEEPELFNLEDSLNELPVGVIKELFKSGITIETTYNMGAEGKYGTVTSSYSHRSKKIKIQIIYSNGEVLFHEIGHAISYNNNPIVNISTTKKFLKIYNEEKDILFPSGGEFKYQRFNIKYDYLKSNPEEYFAHSFSMYLKDNLREDLDTYKFIDKLIKTSNIKK